MVDFTRQVIKPYLRSILFILIDSNLKKIKQISFIFMVGK